MAMESPAPAGFFIIAIAPASLLNLPACSKLWIAIFYYIPTAKCTA